MFSFLCGLGFFIKYRIICNTFQSTKGYNPCMNNKSIQDLFHFDTADLEVNRKGDLSPKQRERLARNLGIARKWGMIFGIGLFGITICLVLSIVVIFLRSNASLEKIIWAGFIGFFALVTFLAALYSISRGFKKTKNQVEKVQGPIKITTIEKFDQDIGGQYTQSTLYVGGREFSILSELAGYVIQGDTYAVYFIRNSGYSKKASASSTILSMELVS